VIIRTDPNTPVEMPEEIKTSLFQKNPSVETFTINETEYKINIQKSTKVLFSFKAFLIKISDSELRHFGFCFH